jgi:hypothetical protein
MPADDEFHRDHGVLAMNSHRTVAAAVQAGAVRVESTMA